MMRKKRLLAGLLALVMLVGLLPTASLAAEVDLSTLVNIADGLGSTNTVSTSQVSSPIGYTTEDHPEYLTDGQSTEFKWVGEGIQDYIGKYGNPWVNFSFGENRSIGGIKVTFHHDNNDDTVYKYNVLGKAAGASDYETLFSSCTGTKKDGGYIQTHAFASMREFSDIKLEFTNESSNAWLVITQLEIFGEPDSYEGLIEVAPLSEITVPSNEGDAGKIVDKNTGTWWVSGNGSWPANVDFALPGNMLVKRVEVDFERFEGRTFDLAVSRAVNNVTTDYQELSRKAGHSANETYIYSMDDPQRMTHVRVSLLATNGAAWPAIAEVRIYAVDETIDLKNYDDITSHASPSQGTGYKEWNFGGNQQVVGFRVALAEGAAAVLKGKMKRDKGWTTYFAPLQNGDNVFRFPAGMSIVRVELDDPGQLASLQIFGTYAAPIVDNESVAFDKASHSNFNAPTSYLVNDGDKTTGWKADMYPAYVDIDLEENYTLSELQIFTPTAGYTEYTLYTSMDGRDFDKVGEKLDAAPCAEGGDKFPLNKEARIIRVYLEYYSESAQPILNEIRALGTASGTAVQTAPAVDVGLFEDTAYASPITQTDTINEVKGIIERQVGPAYVDWFTFSLEDQSNGYDYFTLSDEGGKVKVTGNNGVSLATGINHYLKYFCNVNISQVGCQTAMPAAVVPVGSPVHRETRFPVRYAYNYCTHSYSMAFWGEEEWRNELDWLALNGVNVVLDITGQEEVWRKFLMKEGYTHEEAKDFLAGPGYYAWAYMANLTGFGGPIHDSWLTERAELGRKNQRIMRALGMEPVLQAFSGMVPVDIATHDPTAEIIPQGVWCSFRRPTMLKTNTATYDKYAQDFYEAQREVFGDAKYYATDPFHEGGDTGGMDTATVASALLDSLLDFDSDAVWVIQSWQGNPSNGLLAGLRQGTDRRDHAIVLDLYAEKDQNWKTYGEDTDGDGLKEFSDTPWVFCQLNNFGGRMGLHGHLDALQKNIPAAANSTQHMAGIGIAPEASQENPLLYDFLFETVWTPDASVALPEIDLDQWLADYATRRYGAESENAQRAVAILAETVYKDSLNRAGQGAPESVVNARPALSIGAASTWGNSSIGYDRVELEKAARLLLEDYDTLSASDAYLYDLADVLKQVLSNSAQVIHGKMANAYWNKDAAEFSAQADRFLALIALNERVLSTRKEFLFGSWTTNASELAQNADEFTKRLYLRNAKALVTTWGSIDQCDSGGLKDYSNRQWAGLTKDFYQARWEKWINVAKANLAAGSNGEISIKWFPWEWAYARNPKAYSNTPSGEDLKELGLAALEKFGAGPEELDIYDLEAVSAQAGSQETASESAPASNVLDGLPSTFWHTQYSTPAATREQMWITLDLGQVRMVDGLRYLPRQGNSNGMITGYEIYVSLDNSDWTLAASGSWGSDSAWKKASFAGQPARYVKLKATASAGEFATAAELRATGSTTIPVTGVTLNSTAATLYTNDDTRNSLTLTPSVLPEYATSKGVTWDTSDPDIATVNGGVVTAVGVDHTQSQAVITVTTDDGGFTAQCVVTVKTKVSGQTHIVGEAKFDQTLTASVNQVIPPQAGKHLTCQWLRNGSSIPGAIRNSYTLTEDDIGAEITVSACASFPFEGVAISDPVTGEKANGPEAPTGLGHTDCTQSGGDGKITGLAPNGQYEISDDNGQTWTAVTANAAGELGGLAPGSYRLRLAPTATHEAGKPSSAVTILAYGITAYTITPDTTLVGGTITASASQAKEGTEIILTVTADDGYEPVEGSLMVAGASGDVTVTDGKFTMPAEDVTVTARFRKKTYTLDHSLTHITCDLTTHTVEHGDKPVIHLTLDDGYEAPETISITARNGTAFYGYEYDGASIAFTHGITQDLTISGAAQRKSYAVIYSLEHMTAQGPAKAPHGQALEITLVPSEGYALPDGVTVTVDGQSLTGFSYDPAAGTLSLPEGAVTGVVEITAAASTAHRYLITYNLDGGTLASPNPGSYTALTPAFTLHNPVKEGYSFAGWTGTGLAAPTTTVTIPTGSSGNRRYTATWTPLDEPEQYTITYDLAGGTLATANPTIYTAQTEAFTLHNPTRSGYTFAGWTGTGLTGPTLTVTIPTGSSGNRSYTATWTADSSSGSSGSSQDDDDDRTTTVTTTTESGERVTTVTDKKTGTVTVTVAAPNGSSAKIVTKGDKTTASVTLSQEALDNSGDAPTVLPVVGLEANKNPQVTVELPKGTGSATVSIPAKKLTATTVAVLVGVDGTETVIPQSLVENGKLTLSVDAGKTIRIEDNKKTFRDVAPADWFAESVAHVTSRELFQGTGGDNFSPEVPMTRGMLVTVLFRYAGTPEGGEVEFPDVEDNAYYTDAVRWAAQEKVITGTGDGLFAPDQVLSREQLAVMLYRYIGSPSTGEAGFENFSDGDMVSVWARDALAWAVETGILRGKDGGRLAPQDQASRAEVSAMLHRFTRVDLLQE